MRFCYLYINGIVHFLNFFYYMRTNCALRSSYSHIVFYTHIHTHTYLPPPHIIRLFLSVFHYFFYLSIIFRFFFHVSLFRFLVSTNWDWLFRFFFPFDCYSLFLLPKDISDQKDKNFLLFVSPFLSWAKTILTDYNEFTNNDYMPIKLLPELANVYFFLYYFDKLGWE